MAGVLDLMGGDFDQQIPGPPAQVPFTDFTDVAGTTFEETFRNFGSVSKFMSESLESMDNLQRYRAAAGGSHLIQDAINSLGDEKLIDRMRKETNNGDIRTPELLELMDNYVKSIREQDPNRFKNVFTQEEISEKAREKAVESKRVAEQARAGATTFDSITGSLAGGVAAGFTDPIQLSTMAFGAPLASGIVKTMLVEAAINVGTEIAIDPFIASWQKELGEEYGLSERLTNVTFAGLFGAGFGGFVKSVPKVLGRSKSYALRLIQDAAEREGAIEDALAAHFISRDFYLKEAKPNGVDVDTHFRAVSEVENAIREQRTPRLNEIIPKMDEVFQGKYANEIQADLAARIKKADNFTKSAVRLDPAENLDKKPTVGDNFADPHRPELDNQKLLAEMYDSQEYIARTQKNFDDAIARAQEEQGLTDDSIVFRDEDGIEIDGVRKKELTLKEMQEHFKENESVINAISNCSIGGGS